MQLEDWKKSSWDETSGAGLRGSVRGNRCARSVWRLVFDACWRKFPIEFVASSPTFGGSVVRSTFSANTHTHWHTHFQAAVRRMADGRVIREWEIGIHFKNIPTCVISIRPGLLSLVWQLGREYNNTARNYKNNTFFISYMQLADVVVLDLPLGGDKSSQMMSDTTHFSTRRWTFLRFVKSTFKPGEAGHIRLSAQSETIFPQRDQNCWGNKATAATEVSTLINYSTFNWFRQQQR